jgi:hypothetical protein
VNNVTYSGNYVTNSGIVKYTFVNEINKIKKVNYLLKSINMKKIVLCVMATFLSLTFLPLQSNASTTAEPSSLVGTKPAESKTLELRLTEIKATDMSKLKASEKKNLRKEVRSINHKLRELGGGVYLSAGALILIVILLIILL